MRADNLTCDTTFILVGLTNDRETQKLLFGIILVTYALTLVVNLGVIMLIQVDSHLHTPMYFFLTHLSSVEMGYVTSTVPQMLGHLLMGYGGLSLVRCALQMNATLAFGSVEALLVGVQVASRPLLSHLSSLESMPLHYGKHEEGGPGLVILIPLSAILISYGLIFFSVLQMQSASGVRKALSTCSSHLLVVVLFYGTITLVYIIPRSGRSPDVDKQVAVLYVVVTPLLNPIIYTLRNKDVHQAMTKSGTFSLGGQGAEGNIC
ncbi:olfactory receptor 502-like [Sphaerodactylus townsendi]|uniref:olfactory receptor 502-like n=1 Tax=Sphaerodactylus townsendi TaxID=933632 RepID=UPI00202666BE|nr:olfactory receptor 502-like [Sphaerodactylus townsendi]